MLSSDRRYHLEAEGVTIDIHMGDLVRMRKPHPCGGYEWRVMRVGADIGLKCQTCARVVMIPRGLFERRLKEIISRWPQEGRTGQ